MPNYDNISQKLVFKQGKKRPRKLKDLDGNLVVTALSSHVENLQKLKVEHPELSWQENSELDTQELLLEILDDNIY